MSSHHFVKEGQEPAVWILGTKFNEDILGTLLEWSPYVVASLDAAEKLLSLQIKIDRIITEENNEASEKLFQSLYPVEWRQTDNLLSDLWNFIEKHSAHVYLTGMERNQLGAIFQQAPTHLKQYLIGITLTEKWVCPPGVWKKWFAKDQVFELTGETSCWIIKGHFSQRNSLFISEIDQLLHLENSFQECFIEHIQTHHT